jgi:16S rRNA (cytosine967-C5)-methyltransferase
VLRWLRPIDARLKTLMHKPLLPKAAVARDALRLAVAETAVLDTPDHAAVDAAVRLTKAAPEGAALAGLVNAVARKAVAMPLALDPETALPGWMVERVRRAWKSETSALLRAMTSDAPLDLTLREPAEGPTWTGRLGAILLPNGSLRLYEPGQITTLPGYAEGAWWVQDAAASLPARLLNARPGERVLDLCAAPGGKALQLAAGDCAVTALDMAADRLARVAENLDRTGLSATLVEADALTWQPTAPFPAILLDAPCSATGTLRRHPDLPHLRRDSDIAALLALQDQLLDAAWRMLAPGGRLVYATCSLLHEEGEDRIRTFLARNPDAALQHVSADEASDGAFVTEAGMLRTRPHAWDGGLDGFFAARLLKSRETKTPRH